MQEYEGYDDDYLASIDVEEANMGEIMANTFGDYRSNQIIEISFAKNAMVRGMARHPFHAGCKREAPEIRSWQTEEHNRNHYINCPEIIERDRKEWADQQARDARDAARCVGIANQ